MTSKKRTWDAAVGRRDYVATSAGGAMQIALNGVVVWTGRRLGVGKYEEQQSAIPEGELAKVLERLRVGDAYLEDEHPRAPAPPRAPAAEPARTPKKAKAPTSKEPKSAKARKGTWHVHVSLKGMEDHPITTYPFDTEDEARAFAKTKREELAQHPGSLVVAVKGGKATKKPKKAAAPKAAKKKTPKAAKKTAPRAAKKTAPKAAKKTAPTGETSAKPAVGAASASGPRVSQNPPKRAPASADPAIDDTRVLAQVRAKLKKEDPTTADAHYAKLHHIWLAGGREATVAWMKEHTIKSPATAFLGWLPGHQAEATRMLSQAPGGAA